MRRLIPYLPRFFVFSLSLVIVGFIGNFQVAQLQEATPEATPNRDVGLLLNDTEADNGYVLYTPLEGHAIYVLDKQGQLVRSLDFDSAITTEPYLLDNGNLLFASFAATSTIDNPFVFGGAGGLLKEYSPDGKLVWSYQLADAVNHQHHDFTLMPNGHILLLAWEVRSSDIARAAGAKPDNLPDSGQVFFEEVVEIDPATNQVVWEWHLLDHLVQDYDPKLPNYGDVQSHPERIDINYPQSPSSGDWYHDNSIDYSPELDQILISTRGLSEIWVIDHSNSTAQAASSSGGRSGKGGDLLYRWGNPSTYQSSSERLLYFQHDAHWIKPGLPGAGDILIFDNGGGETGPQYSRVVEITPPLNSAGTYDFAGSAFGPPQPVWEFTADPAESLFSPFIGSAQRLPNGNTFIDGGPEGRFWEVTSDDQVVWKFANALVGDMAPSGYFQPYSVFRARYYAADNPGMVKLLAVTTAR